MTLAVLLSSVLLGYVLAQILGKRNWSGSKYAITFSGAYLFAITIMHMLPEIFSSSSTQWLNSRLVLLGFLTQFILEFISKGLEHGHAHKHSRGLPYLMFIGLFIHEFFEGLPLGAGLAHAYEHEHLHENLLLGIAVHKFPIAFIIYNFLQKSDGSKILIYLLLVLFMWMTPIGMLVSSSGWIKVGNPTYLLAFTMGIFLHVSTTIIFESSESHQFNMNRVRMTLLGIVAAMATEALM